MPLTSASDRSNPSPLHAAPSLQEQWRGWLEKKIIPPSHLEDWRKGRKEQETVVTTNGAFDLLHAGHLYSLFTASQQGTCLLVLLNSDRSIQTYKDPKRPMIPLEYRLQMVAALAFVDYVSWFEEADPIATLCSLQPHVHVKGAEYRSNCLEQETIEQHGGKVVFIERIPSLSTTEVVTKVGSCVS